MRKNVEKKTICFAASSGGHFEQIMMLKPLMKKYNSFILTERTNYLINNENIRMYYLQQVNRKEWCWPFFMFWNIIKSFMVFIREKPDAIICTGVFATLPMCMLCKCLKRKIIYIESYAKVTTPTKTGRFLYKYADQFYVQWESMLLVYPEAIFLGGIY